LANALYGKGRENFANGEIDWVDDTIKVALIDSTYSVAIDTHDFWDDVSGDIVGTAETLANASNTLGTCDADDVTFSSVTGSQVHYLVIYRDSGVAATSQLIAYIDTATGLPVTPNGGDITVTWDAAGIFTL
jgi:hypothetical protein